jgi:hypothetical protein
MSVQEWGWIDDPEDEVEFTCNMCGNQHTDKDIVQQNVSKQI